MSAMNSSAATGKIHFSSLISQMGGGSADTGSLAAGGSSVGGITTVVTTFGVWTVLLSITLFASLLF
jgi:hypothetical protein